MFDGIFESKSKMFFAAGTVLAAAATVSSVCDIINADKAAKALGEEGRKVLNEDDIVDMPSY